MMVLASYKQLFEMHGLLTEMNAAMFRASQNIDVIETRYGQIQTQCTILFPFAGIDGEQYWEQGRALVDALQDDPASETIQARWSSFRKLNERLTCALQSIIDRLSTELFEIG